MKILRNKYQALLDKAGIKVNGNQPWDIQIHDERVYMRIFLTGTLGLGEAYEEGLWDCKDLDGFISRVLWANLDEEVGFNVASLFSKASAALYNQQTKLRSLVVAENHYDIGNDLYERMLGPTMMYTCAYFDRGAKTLDEAQEDKMQLVAEKLMLPKKEDGKKPLKILDIGCGWGGLGKFLTTHYNVQYIGVTISEEQARYAKEWCRDLPVTILLQDYRTIKDQTFDRVVSLGMFEHVGKRNYRTFMKVVHKCLADDGLFLLHTIGGNTSVSSTDPWIGKYIFPNSMIPSKAQINSSVEGLFVEEEWHNLHVNYDQTLMKWFENFDNTYGEIQGKGIYTSYFYRRWKYYLLTCAGSFRARKNQLWQFVFSKNGLPRGVPTVR